MDRPYIIAHISDLHCGSRYHIPSLATRVIDELNALEPDVVIVTGDLTDMGFRSEFRQAHRLIDQLKCENRLVLIGNHDARNVGDVHFEELFGARRRELELEGMRIVGLDSSEPDPVSGRIGRDSYRWLEERFAFDDAEFKVVAMHHHLVPVPGTGRNVSSGRRSYARYARNVKCPSPSHWSTAARAERRTLEAPAIGLHVDFPLDDSVRHRFLEGLDDIGITLQHEAEIAAYEGRSRV